ncbi:MAG: pilin [bacterium]|nr:pilin [bacterium]
MINKSEARNPKHETNLKFKILNYKFWVLRFGYWNLFVICCLGFVILSSSSSALEVSFPTVQGAEVGDSMGPAEWIKYIFLLAQALVGLAIIYAFVRAGLLWMTGGDNQTRIGEAKKWITGAITGLVILLGSYLFLKTINPQLVNIKNPGVNFGTDAPSGILDFWNKLFFKKHGVGESCGSSFDCQGLLECVRDPKNPRASSGVCTNTSELFLGYEAGHACGKDSECGDDLTCDDEKKVCVAGTKTAGGSICGPGNQCSSEQRCFKTSSGELAENIPGECSSYKALGEDCRTDIANECRGIGTECDLTTKKCIKK